MSEYFGVDTSPAPSQRPYRPPKPEERAAGGVWKTPPRPKTVKSAGRPKVGILERHAQVFDLLAEGCTNAEIAARLGRTRWSVKGLVEHGIAALGASNRTAAAVRWALRRQAEREPKDCHVSGSTYSALSA